MEHIKDSVILIKGAGEKASAVAHRLYECGFRKILMTDIPLPTAERRDVSFCEAIIEGRKEVCGVPASRAAPAPESIQKTWEEGSIAVVPDPRLEILKRLRPEIFIDAVMAKKNTGTTAAMAPLVIALGPCFTAGKDAHLVVETNPASNDLGRVIASSSAETDTGTPPQVLNYAEERVLRAPIGGVLTEGKGIGVRVEKGDVIALIDQTALRAGVSGTIWGLVRDGVSVRKGQKIGDIDPRGESRFCREITPHARAIAGGVLEGILRYHNGRV
ncbi:MAG: EF2563 family selenium-dependent molybdenum hydroxylase system protein [Deltaproteobacteria bacterium]|nr:EF2563 family selenium-dependent molybdenum hydroxylase system protein [Deltaproteobacteria bacterium]